MHVSLLITKFPRICDMFRINFDLLNDLGISWDYEKIVTGRDRIFGTLVKYYP